jgi:multidrug resistance protein
MTGFGMIIPLIPFYATNLGAGPSSIGLLIASFSIMQVIFSPILGGLSDRLGRRPVLLISIFTSITSFILFTLATSFWILLLSRVVAGLATEAGVAQAYIADITTREERAEGMGKVGASLGMGFIIGPAIGGLLSPYGFWAPGVAAVILSIINFFFVLFFLPETPKNNDSSEDKPPKKESKGFFKTILSAFTTPLTGSIYLIYFIATLAFSTIPVIVPLLAVDLYNFTSVEMSYIFMYIGILQVFFQGVAINRINRIFSDKAMIIIGPLFMLCGIFLMPLTKSLILFFASLTIMSAGVSIINTTTPSFLSQRTSSDEQGGVLGLTQAVSSIARVPGPLIGGIIYDLGGTAAPFYTSSALLVSSVVLGCRVFQLCKISQ